MKNPILSVLILCMTLVTVSLSAQTGFGVKFSAGIINADETSTQISADGVTVSHNLGYQSHSPYTNLGVYAHRRFDFLFVQTELNYAQFSTNYWINSNIDDVNPLTILEEKNQNLELQIIGGLQFEKMRFGVGPIFRKSLAFESPLADYDFYQENKRTLSGGFQFMAGYDFGLINVQLKYEDMFSNLGDHIYAGNNRTKLNSNLSLLSLGIGIEI